MATKSRNSGRIHSPEGTAMYVYLFTPRAPKDKKGNETGDPKYQLCLVFNDKDTDQDELDAMKDAARRAGEEKFGPKFMDMVKKGKYLWPFVDNEDKVDDDDERLTGFEKRGCSVNFKCADKPGIVDEDAEPIMDKRDIYSGMKARVSCRAYAYDNQSKGVAFYLINVQKTGEGERMSGDPSAEDDFGKKSSKSDRDRRRERDHEDDDRQSRRSAKARDEDAAEERESRRSSSRRRNEDDEYGGML